MHVPAVDVYTTFRCNMRCRHCFVGENLDSGADLDWDLLRSFLRAARARWGTVEVAYLGGEPTLYPHIGRAVELGRQLGLRVRVVSNGGSSLRRLLDSAPDGPPFDLSVSIDGSSARLHDSVRRGGSFDQALASVVAAREKGHTVSGILSVGSHNLGDAIPALRLLGGLGMDHINVHYVSDRGYAGGSLPVPVRDWLALRAEVRGLRLGTPVRFERTFSSREHPLRCAVDEQSELMLFPDGRVFQCSMFLEIPDGHSFRWTGGELEPNPAFTLRRAGDGAAERHCPAMARINSRLCREAEEAGLHTDCVFHKEGVNTMPGGSSEKEVD